ncbi:MAG: FKBP-type peptidyl-prolyl cis-trans isomerase [Saprospiraceae bacterium]
MRLFIVLFVSILSFIGCEDIEQTRIDQLNADLKLIDDYIKSNSLTMDKTSDPIYYQIENAGNEDHPKLQNTLTVKYTGYFLDGTTFDSATEVDIALYNTIEGWQIALPLIGVGGKMKVIIPSQFAYAEQEIDKRKNAVLAFDIELINFK